MKSEERLQSIQTLLDIRGRVSVVELAEQFQVAQETIRRDLMKLEKNGVVRKIHGGAISSQNKYEQSLVARFTQNIPQKHQLARLAVELIPPGSTLFIDFGTTTNVFVEHIKELSDLTVFTNSHLIAATLSENPTCEIFVLGGRYDDQIKANLGPMVIEGIGQFFADFAVIGIGGVDPKIGFSDQNIDEAAIAKAMISRSNESIVLVDPSKFNRQGIAHVADFHQVDYLVSSELPDNEINKMLTEGGVVLKVSLD
ncbi:MAG: DeoR/GlpR family DNA-binding transcription regulator [Paracoccaceae bacterium]